jgi:hypothetical protein
MKNKKQIQKIREILKSTSVEFTIKGKSGVFKTCCFGKNSKQNGSIWQAFHGMNVSKWGPTCVTLYTFDMLSNKTVGKIKYSDIENFSPIKDKK